MGYERRFLGQISCCSLFCLLSAVICFWELPRTKGLAYQSFAPALNKERIPEPHEFLKSVVLYVEAGGLCEAFMIKDCKSSKSLLWFDVMVFCDCIIVYDIYIYIYLFFCSYMYISGICFSCTAHVPGDEDQWCQQTVEEHREHSWWDLCLHINYRSIKSIVKAIPICLWCFSWLGWAAGKSWCSCRPVVYWLCVLFHWCWW